MDRPRSAIQYRRFRAPKNHGEQLIDPPLTGVKAALVENREAVAGYECDLQGRSLSSLAADARSAVIEAATRYSNQYRDVTNIDLASDSPIVMTGHQPELYHPGVWFKNFVVDRVAKDHGATAINVLIDNDVIHQPAIRVPYGTVDEPFVEAVAFDDATDARPFEERNIVDQTVFNSFAERVTSKVASFVQNPLVNQFWPNAFSASQQTNNLGSCLSQARHQTEATWGLKTLELPWSQVCDGPSFHWFASYILGRLSHFQQIYNDSLAEYRRVNRVRSQTHPVPALATDGDWLEAPFWLWSTNNPTRRPMFMRTMSDGIEITDRAKLRHHVELSQDGSLEVAVEQFRQLRTQGVKVRSRALITTMFARLCLCDLFIHGIGGAKYDQLTDAIIQRFFGVDPPQFVTATATAKLPINVPSATDGDVRSVDLALRELRFNPQRHLISVDSGESLAQQKQLLISDSSSTTNLQERHQQIAHLNAAMQPLVASERSMLQDKRAELMEQLRINRLLGSREFAFCLFPESTLQPFLLDI